MLCIVSVTFGFNVPNILFMTQIEVTFLLKFIDGLEVVFQFLDTDLVSEFYKRLKIFDRPNFVFCHKDRFLKKDQKISSCIDPKYPVYAYAFDPKK